MCMIFEDNGLGKLLIKACEEMDASRVKELLSVGADASWQDTKGQTPAWICANSCSSQGMQIMIPGKMH